MEPNKELTRLTLTPEEKENLYHAIKNRAVRLDKEICYTPIRQADSPQVKKMMDNLNICNDLLCRLR